ALSDADSVQITVVAGNNAPTTVGIADVTVNEDALASAIDLFAAFDDSEDADTNLTYTITGNTDPSLFSSTPIDALAGTLTLNYAADANGIADITVRATDTGGLFTETTFRVTIYPVNDQPNGFDNTVSANEDTDHVFDPADFSWTDNEGHGLSAVVITSLPGTGTLYLDINGDGVADTGELISASDSVSMTDIAAGRLKFKPLANENGAGYTSFTFQIQDDGGTSNGGNDTDSSPNTMTIDVTPVNDAPVLSNNGASLGEGGTENIDAAELAATDQDNSALQLVYTVTTSPGNGFLALASAPTTPVTTFTQSDIDGGQLIYVHDGTETTTDSFIFDLTDGNGATVSAQQFDLTIAASNDAPTALGDTFAVNEDTPLVAGSVLANDTDPDSGALTATLVSGPTNAGTFNLNADGTFNYVPLSNYFGTDTFQYRADDGSAESNTVTVTIHVAPVNDLPTTRGEAYSAVPGETLVELAGVLVNDTDVENDALVAILVSGPANGSLVVNADGSFSYTPDAGFVGTDSFTYMANDGSGNSPVTTVQIEVAGSVEIPDTKPEAEPESESNDPSEENSGENEDPGEETQTPDTVRDAAVAEPTGTVGAADTLPGSAEDREQERLESILSGKSGQVALPSQQQAVDVLEWMLAQRNEQSEPTENRKEHRFGGLTLAFDAEYLWRSLDQLSDQVSDKGLLKFGLNTTVAATTVTATAGYVIWSMRGGFLMATMVSALPTWSHIDPLPVLDRKTGRNLQVTRDQTDRMFD
ncbi:MAG: tandem-95 repeat protein, partial [Pirellulaceae bacterium]